MHGKMATARDIGAAGRRTGGSNRLTGAVHGLAICNLHNRTQTDSVTARGFQLGSIGFHVDMQYECMPYYTVPRLTGDCSAHINCSLHVGRIDLSTHARTYRKLMEI